MARTFTELFVAARSVSTPEIAIKSADCKSTIKKIRQTVGLDVPALSWDCITGMVGCNKQGTEELQQLMQDAGIPEQDATMVLTVSLKMLSLSKATQSDAVVFVQNFQLQKMEEAEVVQCIINLRDKLKASGMTLVLLIDAGTVLPIALQADVMVLEHPLPTRDELKAIIHEVGRSAKVTFDDETVRQACDALIGLPEFPSDQSTAVSTDREKGTLDIAELWNRKKNIVSQMPGLSFIDGTETLKDAAGIESVKKFGVRLMSSPYAPTLILRMDEIEKQFAGSATDTSGTKGDLLGAFLTWAQERQVIMVLLLGVPGSSKSWFCRCLSGEYNRPLLGMSISDMQDSLVGNTSKNFRNATRTIDAISGNGRVVLFATANSLRGLPPELLGRFTVTYFFDVENPEAIMDLKVKAYGLEKQDYPAMKDWTGRDVDQCASKAKLLNISLKDAAELVIPLLQSQAETMNDLRMSASGRYLSASHVGPYKFTPREKQQAEATVETSRKFR